MVQCHGHVELRNCYLTQELVGPRPSAAAPPLLAAPLKFRACLAPGLAPDVRLAEPADRMNSEPGPIDLYSFCPVNCWDCSSQARPVL